MAKFNYNIYYKDAQTGQDLASPVTVGYDDFSTAITETQKTFQGYTQRELWENQKKTPSESTYNNRQEVRDYQQKLYEYNQAVLSNRQNTDKVNALKRNPNYFQYNGIAGIAEYNYGAYGYNFFNPVTVYTDIADAETLARPITWSNQGRGNFNFSGTKGARGMWKGITFRIANVSTTTTGKNVNLLFRVNDYDAISTSNPTPGVWLDRYGDSGGIGVWFYDVYYAEFEISFVDDYDRPLKLLTSTAVVDIDFNQQVHAFYNNSQTAELIPNGSRLQYYNAFLGDQGGNEYSMSASIPRGSYMLAGVGTKLTLQALGNLPGRTTIYNPNGTLQHDSWELAFFGNASRGETFVYADPVKPAEPSYTEDITIIYDRVAKIRPWAIRNSGSWKSFVTKDIHMARRTHDSWDKSSTEINVEQVGQVIPRDPRFGYVEPAGSGVIRGNYIRKDGNWKRQGKIGS